MNASRRARRALAVAAASVLAAAGPAAALTLVRDGKAQAVIVLPRDASPAAAQGARVLREHLLQMSGAELPVKGEDEVSGAPEPGRAWVLVGAGRLAREQGFTPEGLGPGAFRVEARGDVLALLGADGLTPTDPDGSLYAVVSFLESLGVRYLWPGESGKVVPRRATVEAAEQRRAQAPALRQRRIRDGRDYGTVVAAGLRRLGFSREEFREREAAASATVAHSPDWFRWQRLGGTLRLETGHAFGRLWERHGKAHPEWFALQSDGTRDQSREPGRARLCKSNPELAAAVAAEKIAELDARPELEGVSLAPNDGGRLSFCSCPACEALDAPGAPEVTLTDHSGFSRREYRHKALTDRMVHFWNAVAEKVTAARPGKLLVVDAYSAYASPPVSRALHPSLVVRFVPMSYVNEENRAKALAYWDGWSKAATRLLFRPNLLFSDRSGTAYLFARRLGEDFKRLASRGMVGTDFDACLHHWATQGLTYYLVARLSWDPSLDVDALIDDYCRAGFGPAAGPVRRYFARLEALTDEAASRRVRLVELFHPAEVAGLAALLDEARLLAAQDPGALARVEFLAAGLRWTDVDSRAHALLRAPKGAVGAAERRETLEARSRAMRELFHERFMAVNVAAVSGAEDGLFRRVLPAWEQMRKRLP